MSRAVPVEVRRARPRGEVLAGLGSALLLVVLLLVLPLVLAVVARPALPAGVRSWPDVVPALLGADDGSLLRLGLVAVAWSAWAAFAAATVAEVSAVVRRRPTPRLPLLAPAQRGAAALVAAVVVLLTAPSAPSAPRATAVATVPVAAQAAVPHAEPAASTGDRTPAPRRVAPREHRTGPTVTVQRHDTLWGLAERHLGSGLRYKEIVALNRGVLQPDGRRLTDPHWIYPGWVLRLPDDARGADPHAHRQRADKREQHPPRAVAERPEPVPLPPAATLVDRAPYDPVSAPREVPQHAAAGSEAAHSPGSAQGTASTLAAAEDARVPEAAPLVALGLGAVTIAGVLAELARQRRRAERTRPTGQRHRRSAVGTERLLRAVPATPTAERVRVGLALLADGCRAGDRPLPRIALVRARADRLELLLAGPEDGPPPSPYRVEGTTSWVWDGPVPELTPDPDRIDPCPALVSVGMDGPDLVMANLEAAGALHVAGEPEQAEPILAAMTLDLTDRARRGAISLAVADEPEPQAGAVGSGGPVGLDREAAAAAIEDHQREVRRVLGQAGLADTAQARSQDAADETWAPQVVVARELAVQPEPWSGAAVVARGEDGWSLRPEPEGPYWRLRPADVRVVPGALTSTDRAHLAELLAPPTPSAAPEPADPQLVAALDAVLAAVSVPAPGRAGSPVVRVLGPVEVSGVDDSQLPGRVRRATELVTYLVLHPGAGRHELDEVMWPGRRVGRSTRNPFVSRARQWLGRDPEGRPYLPLVADEGEYRLLADIDCDWYEFVRAARAALAQSSPDGLEAALAVVRGRPFQGIDPTSYVWAEADAQDMVAVIVDVAHVAAVLRLGAGDAAGAARAAARGLLVEPGSEKLHRDAIRAALRRGDAREVDRAVTRMAAAFESLELDEDELMPETVALLQEARTR